ncbi:MAG: DUF2958 domain-containing protein [Chloroflexota bacterium]|nr:DUF2958 domain-containing protein [Chloroflexota bacterium]MDE2969445.1 DUF2958 domain-containing protein [Chloroflexota bacterium]
MALLGTEILQRLRENRKAKDPVPVVRLYNPYGKEFFLLVAQDAEDKEKYLCVCDIGYGPDYGFVTLSTLEDYDNRGIPLVYDEGEVFDKPWGAYLAMARKHGKIVP